MKSIAVRYRARAQAPCREAAERTHPDTRILCIEPCRSCQHRARAEQPESCVGPGVPAPRTGDVRTDAPDDERERGRARVVPTAKVQCVLLHEDRTLGRSEERRVGKECRSRAAPYR